MQETQQSTAEDTKFKYLSQWDPSDAVSLKTIVVSCFLQYHNKFLILQRARKDAQHGLWGIPGGKLERNEDALSGLKRELLEETQFDFTSIEFELLGTALSQTPSDGQYGLYVFYAKLPSKPLIQIDLNEHYAYQWVTIEMFEALDLLTAQREAYKLVEKTLRSRMYHDLQGEV